MIEAQIAAFFVALGIVISLYVIYVISQRRRLKRLLAGREQISAPRFGAHFYEDPARAEVASFIMQKLEELTGYTFTGAVPTDRVQEDLQLGELDSMASVEILVALEDHYRITVSDSEAVETKTIGDLVELVLSKRGS